MQSNAYSLVVNGDEPDRIKAGALRLGGDLAIALRGWECEMRPLAEMDPVTVGRFVAEELSAFMKLTCGGWPQEHRVEYLDQLSEEFAEVPFTLLLPAVRNARKRVWDPKRFVSWVFDSIETKMLRLSEEGRILNVLGKAVVE